MGTLSATVLASFALSALRLAADSGDADKDAIRDVLVRHYVRTAVGSKTVVFLVFDKDTDPTDEFIARLADLRVPIRKGSRAKVVSSENDPNLYFDRVTGEAGVIVTVSNVRLINGTKGEADGDCYLRRRAAFGDAFTLRKADGKWKIVQAKRRWRE